MTLRNALLAASILALPSLASAQAVNGMYVGGGAGVNFLQDESLRYGMPGSISTGLSRPDLGGVGVLSLGWGFGNGFRAEIEGDYRENGLGNPGGLQKQPGVMANVLYDFVGVVPMVQPYIGAGVGYQWVIEQGLHGHQPTYNYYGPDHNQGGFAYQAILGAAYPITSVPGLSLTAEYRFMGMVGDRGYGITATTGPAMSGPITFRNDFNHSLLIGLRYEFGAPAPAAVPAPMPVADLGAKTFLVFFDWDKSDLTARSSAIVQDAATYSRSNQYTRIDVNGNTDTSGTPTYNMGLSERRARVVAGELVRDGVPQNAISMHAYGDTHLLVPTGPDTREPQNRRVEIVYH